MLNLVQKIKSTVIKTIEGQVSHTAPDKDTGLIRVFVNRQRNDSFLLDYTPREHSQISVEVYRRPGLPFKHHSQYKYGQAHVIYNSKTDSNK